MNGINVSQVNLRNKTHLSISIKPDKEQSFLHQLDGLRNKYNQLLNIYGLNREDLIFAKIFISDTINQEEQLKNHSLFKECFDNCGFSIIEQPPLDGNKINVILWFAKGLLCKKYRHENAFYIETDKLLHIFHSVRHPLSPSGDIEMRTKDLFGQHKSLLQKEQMIFSGNCLRTWLYVRDIDKDYNLVVKGRNSFFEENNLTPETHFITSTGIEGKAESPLMDVVIDFYSVGGIDKDQVKYLEAREYLNPTYEYGVAFERGTCLTLPDAKMVSVSGTASIDKSGNCIHLGNVTKQLERIFLNIRKLLEGVEVEERDITQMIVYVRDASDAAEVIRFIDSNYNQIPHVIVSGKVCRPQWLVEIECIALKKNA